MHEKRGGVEGYGELQNSGDKICSRVDSKSNETASLALRCTVSIVTSYTESYLVSKLKLTLPYL